MTYDHAARLDRATRAAQYRSVALTLREIGERMGVTHGAVGGYLSDAHAFGLVRCGCHARRLDFWCEGCPGSQWPVCLDKEA